jgi:type III pantothenate kinase
MVLTVNIGNTNVTVGAYREGVQSFCGQFHSDALETQDEYAVHLLNLLALRGASKEEIDGAIIGSVVPVLTPRLIGALRTLTSARILTVGPGLKSGLKLCIDSPAQLGADLLCGIVAARTLAHGPVVVISSDTALTMMAATAKNELIGGAILPGPQLSLASLIKNTAQLPQIDLTQAPPSEVLGKSTAACLESGMILGTASLLDGMAERFKKLLGSDVHFFATGTLPESILRACSTPIDYRESLISDGMYEIWVRNRKN